MNNMGNILIVDDENGPRESLKMILRPHYNIVEANGGFQTLQIIREQQIDLVTLDLRMPEMDGTIVLMAIKKHDPTIQVLIITGYATLANAVELVKLGACGYLVKPFQIPRLLNDVAKAIDKRRKVNQLNL
jgi:DNA-binding NtrC family response regulator